MMRGQFKGTLQRGLQGHEADLVLGSSDDDYVPKLISGSW